MLSPFEHKDGCSYGGRHLNARGFRFSTLRGGTAVQACRLVSYALSEHLSGGDHLHSGTVVGKLEGDRGLTLGFVDFGCGTGR
jgi:hypothetical protein